MSLRLIVIVGPTATGKTRLAVAVAHRLGSEIISADSRQVYIGLDLGTGKDLDEYAAVSPPVSYHLIDIVPPETVYTLYHYQRDCYRLLRAKATEQRFGSGRVPLVVAGGSGLYVEAVLRGYEIADVPEDPILRRRLAALDHGELVSRLQQQDPAQLARTDLTSSKRVIRALEITAARRKGPVSLSQPLGIELEARVFAIRMDRRQLRRRISDRVEKRLAQGMVEEVRSLLAAGVSPERLQMLGMEYREISAFLSGAKSYDKMVDDLKREIRHLAKRQETYFRGMQRRGMAITWVGPETAVEEVVGGG